MLTQLPIYGIYNSYLLTGLDTAAETSTSEVDTGNDAEVELTEFQDRDSVKCATENSNSQKNTQEIDDDNQLAVHLRFKTFLDSLADDSLESDDSLSNNTFDDIIPLSPKKSNDFIKNQNEKNVKSSHNNNVLILGSKPNLTPPETKRVEIKPLKIELKNIWPYLKGSKQYCKQCFILFPHIEALNCHKKTIHTIGNSDSLKTKNINSEKKKILKFTASDFRCDICGVTLCSKGNLVRHLKTVHKGKESYLRSKTKLSKRKTKKPFQEKRNTKSDENNFCFHCHKEFESQSSLIEHLYDVLKPNNVATTISEEIPNAKRARAAPPAKNDDNIKNRGDTKWNDSTSSKGIKNDSQKANSACKVLIESKLTENVQKKCNELAENTKYLTRNQRSTIAKKNSESESKSHNCCNDQNDDFSDSFSNIIDNQDKVEKCTNIISTQKIQAYQCYICSQYMKYWKRYSTHMAGHNIRNVIAADTVIFDSQCQFCNMKMPDEIQRYNTHISNLHRERMYKKINTLEKALDSVVFKCLKCEICFLTANASKKHSEHVAIFVNWKCPECHILFKINDRAVHLKQHLMSKKITVYALSDSALDRVLYKCLKCAVHFSENEYFSHHATCDLKTPNSAYCKKCDILVNRNDIALHELKHKDKKLQLSDFSLIESDIINNRPQNKKLKCMPQTKSKFALTFCSKCNCFVRNLGRRRRAHIEGQCVFINPRLCRKCGLIFTSRGYLSHKLLHDKNKNLNLQSFYFYDVKTEKQIRPPIPKYPSCDICEVHFLGKKYIKEHLCTKQNSVTCNYCNIQLTEAAFKLHINFHNYKLSTNLINQKKANYNAEYTITSTTDNDNGLKSLVATKTVKKYDILSPTLKGKISSSLEVEETVTSTTSTSIINNSSAPNLISNIPEKTIVNDSSLIYICIICQATVDMYDKAVEHCHDHYDCNKSLLKHKDHLTDGDVFEAVETQIKFDPFFIRFDKDIWIQHVFGKLTADQVANILDHSKYKFEHRLKLEVLHPGLKYILNDLTLFKCEICRCYVEPDELYAHVGSNCIVKRKHPCSVCGSRFYSESYKNIHEKTHENQSPIKNNSSYTIIAFNKQIHHHFTQIMLDSRSKFILYQCRNCEVVIDKLHRGDHMCSSLELIKCLDCGLLFYEKDLKLHVVKHELIKQFETKRIIVIIFGKIGCKNDNKVEPSFKGTIYDFTFYKCTTCGVCFKTKPSVKRHVCVSNSSEFQCSKCCLRFFSKDLTEHLQLHENLLELVLDDFNSNIISFTKNVEVVGTPLNEMQEEIEKESNVDNLINNDMTQRIYKCGCGLHFLEESNAKKHLSNCYPRMKISKQSCFKCDLLFTPGELFNHLLKHHSNKKLQYRYDIVSVSEGGESENSDVL